MPRLRVETGKQAGKSVDLNKPAIIGRGESTQLQISDTHASREHCKVFEQAGAWVVADLNSRNGIKVNGVQSTRKNLSHGDKIAIGETVIVFESGGPSPAAPAAAAAAPAGAAAAPARGGAAAASAKKEQAFAAARASSGARGGRAAATKAAPAESGLKVSDHVLQFNKVDAKNATLLDIDLSQSPGMSRFLMILGCLAFLALVVWGVAKMMG